MSDLPEDSRSAASATGGGAAASAGIAFQQQLGAYFGVYLLSGRRLDERLNLGSASPVLLRFETEAPVDDILVCTSADGYIAIQAKTTVSLSQNLKSPFGKTVSQFVRHWISCRDGDGSRGWNRPLDPARDRLVLAVSAHAPTTVRGELPAALRRRSQQGSGVLTKAQLRALKCFDSCVTQVWASLTTARFDSELLDQLADLLTVFVFDPSGADRTLMREILVASMPEGSQAAVALAALETVSGQMMAQRGGADVASLRLALMSKGVNLRAALRYQPDIAALSKHTRSVTATLQRHERIEVKDGERASIIRKCQDVVETAALEDSLLIIGEPGAGKSGVLNALARGLMDQGKDVFELAVDQHSVESLEGLSNELKLEHGLLDVLEAWDGPGPAWLIIDALDATRGGKGEGVFRTLIAQVLERCQRWRVVASIRTFDLRMGQQFRTLCSGAPPNAELAEPGLPNVRHIRIPPWSECELQQLLDQAPTLSAAFTDAPPRLRELASTPFNTHLLSELIAGGVNMVDLKRVSSQVELLRLYWSHRVERHGAPAERCLRSIVEAMVEARTLRIQKHAPVLNDPGMIDTLTHEGVLVASGDGRWVQFRHHIIFDFTTAKVLLDPNDIINGTQRFAKDQAAGLMLAPALAFVLQEIWDSEPARGSFWTAVANILADRDVDPVIRSAVGRIGADYPSEAGDTLMIAQRLVAGDDKAAHAFVVLSGALGVRIEDNPEAPAGPWIKLLGAIAPNIGSVSGPVRFLLFKFIEQTHDDVLRANLGLVGRALLEHGYSLKSPTMIVSAAIGFVADTYETDRDESRRLLSKVFDQERFSEFAWEEVPAICRKIEAIVEADPAFGTEIYRNTYTLDVTEERTTSMTSSQILPLTSNARQDYDMARYSLGEFIPQFLDKHPAQAVAAIVASVEGYVAREHGIPGDVQIHSLEVADKFVLMREDYSYIWASDPDSRYSHDAEVLVVSLLERLRSADDVTALNLANLLIENATFAVFWSRLFMASVERHGAMLRLLLPFALTEQFLVLPDTQKDALRVVVRGYARLTSVERQRFERQALLFDFSDFVEPRRAREGFLHRLFAAIGRDALETAEARELLRKNNEQDAAPKDHSFVRRSSTQSVGSYGPMKAFEEDPPADAELKGAIEEAKQVLALQPNAAAPSGLTLQVAYQPLGRIERFLSGLSINTDLRISAEDVLAQGCKRIVELKLLPEQIDKVGTDNFLRWLSGSARAVTPQVDESTEESFEEFASWGSPAARVEAAQAVFDLVLQRPDLLPRVSGEMAELLADVHPAVRMQAGLHLIRLWDLDRDGFWGRLKDRLKEEANTRVLEYIVNRVLGHVLRASPEVVESLILGLLKRPLGDGKRRTRLHSVVARLLAALWIRYERSDARAVVQAWATDPARYHEELGGILSTMRAAFVVGLTGAKKPGDDALRHRALELAVLIVDAASQGLAAHNAGEVTNRDDNSDATDLARLLNTACLKLYFASGAGDDAKEANGPTSGSGLDVFFIEAGPLLERIGDCATPHTVYYLLKLLEFLLPVDPARAFDLMSHALQSGGKRTGFHFEPLGADLIVRLVGVLLADHKEIFENEKRRTALIQCLEIFMDAGWPAAQRLLYRLPELVQ